MTKKWFYIVCICLSLVGLSLPGFNLSAHEAHLQHSTPGLSAINVAFDSKGNLWRVFVKDGYLWVDKTADLGKTFSAPVKVNPVAQTIGVSNEARPNIALDADDHIYVTWVDVTIDVASIDQTRPQKFRATSVSDIWFARSVDMGKSFEKPYPIHQDKLQQDKLQQARAEFTHTSSALNVSAQGKITVTWIDGRDAVNAKKDAKKDAKNNGSAAIYYAVSNNHGESFTAEKKLADGSCECCHMTTINKPDGTVVAMWRHVFEGGDLDHMMAEIPPEITLDNAKPQLHRATFGHWKIDGCPHHGAALATGGEGANWWGYHLAYFDGNDTNINQKSGPGLYYSRMDGVAWASSPAKKFGNYQNQAGHPAILSVSNKTGDEHVWLVWREIDAENTQIIGLFSADDGRSWGDAKVLASTVDQADYPQLLQYDQQVYLAWNMHKEGFQLIALKP